MFFYKVTVNILHSVGHVVSVTAIQFCPYRTKVPQITCTQMGVAVYHENFICKNEQQARYGL